MPLAGMELDDLRLERVTAIASEALAHARGLEDPLFEHGALAMFALGLAAAGRADEARAPLNRAFAFVADADDSEIGPYPQLFCDLAWALGYLDRYEEALSQLRREVAISHRTGRGCFIPVLLAFQLHPLIQLGRLPEAIAVGEEAVEAAWTSGNPGLLLGAHGELALARHFCGATDGAQRAAREAVRLAPKRACGEQEQAGRSGSSKPTAHPRRGST